MFASPIWESHLSLSHVENDDAIFSPRVGNNLVITDLCPRVLIQMSADARLSRLVYDLGLGEAEVGKSRCSFSPR